MENATKALLIAAAILITIIIISIGITVVNQGQASIEQIGSGMSEAENTAFNAKFNSFASGTKNASDIKRLIDAVSLNNSTEKDSGNGRFVAIGYKASRTATTTTWYGMGLKEMGTSGTEPADSAQIIAKNYNEITGTGDSANTYSALKNLITATQTYNIKSYKSSIGLYYAFVITAQ